MSKKTKNTSAEIADTSPKVFQRSKIKNELKIKERTDLTDKQKEILKTIEDKDTKIIFIAGPAGSSKSYVSILGALRLLNAKKVSDILYLRTNVEAADQKLGYLPGDIDNKHLPYTQILTDKMEELLPKSDIDFLVNDSRVSSIPISFMRGLSFNSKIIIFDELQNATRKEIETVMTRIGMHTKLILIGDNHSQSDIGNKSGFNEILRIFSDEESERNGIKSFEFSYEDIVRSGICRFIVEKLDSNRNSMFPPK